MANAPRTASTLRRTLSIVATTAVGMVIGIGIFGIGHSGLTSYFSTDPENCANCHVMQGHYDAWEHGGHRNVATCDDCHLPHNNPVSRLLVQAEDGLLHGYKFTTGDYPTNIVIRDSSRAVTNEACLHCHGVMTSSMRASIPNTSETITCTHCHANVGHEK